MFVLSPFVATTTASARSMPAASSVGDVERVALDGDAVEALAEALEGLRALVDHGDVPAGRLQPQRHGRADAPAADDDRVPSRSLRRVQHQVRSVARARGAEGPYHPAP